MISRRRFLTGSIALSLSGFYTSIVSAVGRVTPWRNWSGWLLAHPRARLAPLNEGQLVDQIKGSTGAIRPVGAGHSFTPLALTDDNLVVMDKMSGIISHDKETNEATLWAGTRLADSGPMLDELDQAMFNLPDIDHQTLAGAIATSTHGTGKGLKSLSGYVTGLRLVTPSGEVLDLNKDNNSDLFNAARVSFGALGVITRIRFKNREPFRLRTQTWIEKTEDVLKKFDQSIEDHQHYEMMPLVHSDYSLVVAHTETDDALQTTVEEDYGGAFISMVAATPIMLRKTLIHTLALIQGSTEAIGESFNALTNLRHDRFNEMEYSVPLASGPDCLREILATIERESIDVAFPLEYRIVDGDDTWLSMFAGGPRVSISVHRMASKDYHPLFDWIEPIFWKYNGRPHWGKVHTLGYEQLKYLYPRYDDFITLQASLDPEGRMLNDHLKYLLGK